jgi:hypothetical protein
VSVLPTDAAVYRSLPRPGRFAEPNAPTMPAGPHGPQRLHTLALPAALLIGCAFSAGVHIRLAPGHMAESAPLGVGFVVAGALLLVLGIGAFVRPRSASIPLAIAVVIAVLTGAYVLSRTAGLPVLHPEPEAVDAIGVITKAVELAALALACRLPVENRSRPLPLPKQRSTT